MGGETEQNLQRTNTKDLEGVISSHGFCSTEGVVFTYYGYKISDPQTLVPHPSRHPLRSQGLGRGPGHLPEVQVYQRRDIRTDRGLKRKNIPLVSTT